MFIGRQTIGECLASCGRSCCADGLQRPTRPEAIARTADHARRRAGNQQETRSTAPSHGGSAARCRPGDKQSTMSRLAFTVLRHRLARNAYLRMSRRRNRSRYNCGLVRLT